MGGNESNNNSWRNATFSAMSYDRGRLTMTQTGNPYVNAAGSYYFKKGMSKSEENWEKARQLAEKQGELEEFEKKRKDWNDYMFDEMFNLDDCYS